MKVGISLACFYPEHPEDVIDTVCDCGFEIAELFLNTVSELDCSYITAFSKKCEKRGLEIYSIHPFTSALENYMFFSPYDRRISDSIEFYSRYCDVAKMLGAKVINIHGDRGLGLSNPQKYFECLKPLMDLSRQKDVKLSHENVFFNSVNHPDFVRLLRAEFGDEIRFTLDIKQANRGGSDPYDVCDAMGDNVSNFHVNDFRAEKMCTLPGNGVVDHMRVINTLLKNKYNGPAIIEVYRDNFENISEIVDSKIYLEKIIKDATHVF